MTEAGLSNTTPTPESTPTPETSPSPKRPKVLIVGAGLGGVVLGALLEKAGVPYDIYERAAIVKPLGKMPFLHSFLAERESPPPRKLEKCKPDWKPHFYF